MVDLVKNVEYKNRTEASVKHLGQESVKELERMRDFLDEVLED